MQTDYTDIGKGYTESYEVSLKNHKESEDVVVTVEVQVWGDWKIINSNYDYTMKDAWTAEFQIPVSADEIMDLTSRFVPEIPEEVLLGANNDSNSLN